MEDAMCPKCGSKRTTEIAAGGGRTGSVWCHACGSVTEKPAESGLGEIDVEAIAEALRR